MTSRVVLFFSSFSRVLKSFTPWALGILIIGGTLIALTAQHPQLAGAAWYDDLFAYRRAIRFGNTGATVTDQKVLIQINTSSTSGLIQDERMQTDCDDTRFTDANGRALQYFIDVSGGAGVGCNDTSTDYYVLMPRIEGGGDTLMYMYYGNYNAVTASAGANFSQATFSPTSGPSIAAEEAGTAPLLYWNLDEGYGTTANDLTIQRNNGTITGSWATDDLCVSGKCLQLNGSSHKVIKTYASDFELDVSSNSFTVSLWMRHASALAGTDTLVSRVSSGGYKIAASSGSFCFAIDDDASTFDPDDSACTTSTYNDSLWHYVTAVKNGTTSITLYVDGNQVAQDSSLTGTGSLSGSSPEFDVGVDGSSNFFDGAIDEVKVYNTAKTVSQIKAEYSSRSATGEGTSSQIGSNQLPLSNGLVGYWRMDEQGQNECDGTNDTCDVSGNINHGAWTNNAIAVRSTTKFGAAVWFDGTTDYVSVADSTSLSVTTQVSLGLWINSSSSVTSESLLVKNNSYRLVTDANSNPVCEVSDGTTWQTAATSSTALTTSTWYHVGCSYDGQTIRVFVNGQETGRNALVSSIGDNANALEFGRDAGGTYTDFGGVLDEARVYNRGLSPQEIQNLSNFAPGPVGWWKMDENTGTSIFDSSGNGNSMAMQGSLDASAWSSCKYGSCLKFDGTNASAELDPSVTLFDDLPQLTATAWIYNTGDPTPAMTMRIISNQKGGNDIGWHLAWDTFGRIRIDVDYTTTNLISRHSALSANTWYFVAVTWDGTPTASTAVHLYVDGVEPATYAQQQNGVGTRVSDASTTQELSIGASPTSSGEFSGFIDDVRVYNYARTGKQIVEDMLGSPKAVSAGGGNAGQTIYWKFDEQQGSTANNAVNPAGSGEWDGTVTGADWRLPEQNCKVNGCLTFSTATDDVSAGDTNFTDSLAAMTVSLWVSPTTLAASRGIVTKSNFSNQNSFAITTGTASDEITVFVASSTSDTANYVVTSGFDLTTSTFSHLAMVYDGGLAAADRVKVYKDGRRISGSVTGTIPTSMTSGSTSNLAVGESDSATYQALDSHLDEVKIYAFALTQNEVLVDANAGSAAAFGGVLGVPGATPHDSEGFGGNPPVGWWTMDENTGTSTTVDKSGNGRNGTLTSITASSWVQGKVGSALSLDGTADLVDIGTGPTTVNSVAFWVYPITTTEYFVNITSTTDYIWASAGTVTATGFTSPTIYVNGIVASSITANQWNHVVVTSSTSENASNLDIGRTQDTNYLEGRIDEVRLYDYVLSAAQVAYHYNRGAPIAWYKFDECQGNTAFDSSLKPGSSSIDMSGGKPGNISFGASGNTAFGTCGSGTATEMWNNGTTGKMNASLDVDGTDDVVTVTNEDAIDMDTGLQNGFTISAWVNPASAGESNVGQIWNKGTNSYCRTDNPSGSDLDIECNLDLATTDANVNVSAGATTGSWTHVAMTYDDASKITVYVNGQSRGTNTGSGATAADTSDLLIGGPTTANFDGQIDDVRIHTYEMTAGQMNRLFNEGSAVRFGPGSGSP